MKKEIIKQFEYSIQSKDNKKITVNVKIINTKPGIYNASLSHEIKETPIGANLEVLCASSLEDLQYRVDKYISVLKEVNKDNIVINESF